MLAAFLIVVVLVGLGWFGWYLFSLRSLSGATQQPMRADTTASLRLDDERGELTVVVLDRTMLDRGPLIAVLRRPSAGGSWLLGLPDVSLSASGSASDTPSTLLAQGRASLIKGVEGVVDSKFGHFLQLDLSQVASAIQGSGGLARPGESTATVGQDALRSQSATTTLGALLRLARQYDSAREQVAFYLRAPTFARSLRGGVVSDLSATELDALMRFLARDAEAGRVQLAAVPTSTVDRRQVLSAGALSVLVDRMLNGEPFGKVTVKARRVVPSSVDVTVHNGAGREGVAGQASRILQRAGYRIKTVGNANQFVYDKTLVVYDKRKDAADAIVRELRLGKVVASRGMYSFDTDVLVIVGGDWPQAP